MSASSTTETSTELTTIPAIRSRYDLPGAHATAVVHIPTPQTVGDDLAVRWSSTEAELLRLGASPRSVGHMGDLLRSTHRRGRPLLITANDESAACCWLGYDLEPSIGVGTLPALVPALHQAAMAPASTMAAAIDRTGADVYRVGPFDIEVVKTVEGEDEHVHKTATGGWSQARHQRHSEVVWKRNASLIATSIADQSERQGADGVVLSGDDREVRLVEAELTGTRVGAVVRRNAGGRHEPGTPARLSEAAMEFRAESNRRLTARALEDLREELGQQDQAIAGSVAVLEAITNNRVKTLFIDLVGSRDVPRLDATVRAGLAHGADIVIGHDFDVDDGVAAILRMAYS